MYLLGHMAIGYIVAWLVSRSSKQALTLWAVFVASILPDFDNLFTVFGLRHGTYTHSLILVGIFVTLLFFWDRRTLPYSAAIVSHIFADMMIGPVGVLLPVTRATFSLNLGMSSRADAVLEIGGLIVMMILLRLGGDLTRLLHGRHNSILMMIPVGVVLVSTLRALSRIFIWRGLAIVGYSSSALPLLAITIGHVILISVMTYSLLRTYLEISKIP